MQKIWRNFVDFFVEALSEDTTTLVALRCEAKAQLQRRLQHLRGC